MFGPCLRFSPSCSNFFLRVLYSSWITVLAIFCSLLFHCARNYVFDTHIVYLWASPFDHKMVIFRSLGSCHTSLNYALNIYTIKDRHFLDSILNGTSYNILRSCYAWIICNCNYSFTFAFTYRCYNYIFL